MQANQLIFERSINNCVEMFFAQNRALRILFLLLAAAFLVIVSGWVVYNAIVKNLAPAPNSGAVVTNGIECANIAK